MNLLTAENISKSFNSDKILFDNISLGINEGDKIGLIGINGTGKSTLLKILAGEEEADSGKLTKGNAVRIAYLPQNPEFDDNESVISEVIKGKKAKNEFWDTEGEARSLLAKFEIDDVEAKVGTLSGGQKKRAALVRTLLDDAEILILDEPTNHLDTAMSEWFEDYLKKMKQALFIITHDRYFLDQVTNRIAELTHGKLYSYVGGYMKYLELKAEREEMEIATERKNAALYKKDLAWMMRGARARSTKQKAHIERFEELKNRDKIIVDKEVVVDSVSSRLGKQIIEIDNISKSYGNKVLFTDFTYMFRRIDRIGIIGKNGSGKSTLLKTILGQVKPDSGNIIIGQTAKIGYFSQDSGELNPNQTVIESAKDIAEYVQTKDGTISASKMLERFLFEGAMQYTKIEKLSGGERRRLALLHTLISAPNILILDEPTNDLDITTLSILEDYLDSFDGVVITVSHDRYFLDRVANRIFSFENGCIKLYEGGYSDYLEKAEPKTEEVKAEKIESSAKKDWKANKATKLKFTYAEQKEFETIDEDIEKLNEAIEKLDAEIEENASRYGKLGELMAEKEKLEKELEHKEERWLYLTELNEKIKAGGK
ncbi:ABC transporter, ATP-binding protein [Catonella morbi ATCC 51271]|uniref:ABC transporter, ATP-binding protein n=1 Tax=Catonella morbi ATCC 51271 TaxID=592026 RepID=V2Y1Y3_9FIRM|nr:ABC-F family ATP-binding cassette domain-containing protein [Catonella morbi]ESL02993.1 ABC transporter, ATP-binding protein [Catonella morbi ATCC 51271]